MIYTKQQWDTVLNKMRKKGIKAIILAETITKNTKVNQDALSTDYINLLNRYLITNDVLSNADIFGVELRNEPILNSQNIATLRKAALLIKQKYPSLQITIGGWKTQTFRIDQQSSI